MSLIKVMVWSLQSLKNLSLRSKGRFYEERALAYLLARGLKLVCRNYATRLGEIDLVMRDGEMLVFVEVRFRKNDSFGGAVMSVDSHKRRKLLRVIQQFLQQSNCAELPCRVDVVGITGGGDDCVEWVKNVELF